jgi:secreted PhoX family phosphatase
MQGDFFACPDGSPSTPAAAVDPDRHVHATQMYKGELARIGNNQMLACDPRTGRECAASSPARWAARSPAPPWTPDGRTMFINVQHPGETPSDRSDPADPRLFSNWPD